MPAQQRDINEKEDNLFITDFRFSVAVFSVSTTKTPRRKIAFFESDLNFLPNKTFFIKWLCDVRATIFCILSGKNKILKANVLNIYS